MENTLWAKHQYAKCFGHWLVSDAECVRCAIADNCEKRTKERADQAEVVDEEEVSGGVEEESQLTPLDYLLQRLAGKYDQETDSKDQVVIHKFRQDGRVMVAVVVGVSGKVKVMYIPDKSKEKVFGRLASIEEVEEILAGIM